MYKNLFKCSRENQTLAIIFIIEKMQNKLGPPNEVRKV